MSDNANPTATLVTSKGEMKIELWPDVAPGTVENFTKLANDGFYDGTCFHRIMAGFMIQGGDPQTKDETLEDLWGTGGPGHTIKAEFNDRPHERGVISMARSASPDSAGSQFFVCLGREHCQHLDNQYTGFGQVIEGMDVVRAIGAVATDGQDRPLEPVSMTSVELVTPAES